MVKDDDDVVQRRSPQHIRVSNIQFHSCHLYNRFSSVGEVVSPSNPPDPSSYLSAFKRSISAISSNSSLSTVSSLDCTETEWIK